MHHLNFKSVTFFYPSRVIGGAEFLFFRLAVYLLSKYGVSISYIDYHDGVVKKMFENENENININFLEYTGSSTIEVNSDSVLITPLSSVYDILFCLKGQFRIFFWSIHPSGLYNSVKLNNRYHLNSIPLAKIGNDLDLMISKKGVFFMDETNLSFQQDIFNFKRTPDFFVPIFYEKRKGKHKNVNKDHIHLGWVGRLSFDKIFSLINVIHHSINFAHEHSNKNLTIHIIGEGDDKNKIEQIKLPSNVQIIFLGTLVGESLTDYVNNNFDLVFAMGTSALEMGSMKKPVILVDFKFTPFPENNKFRWLYQAENYNVAEKFDPNLVRKLSFTELIELVSKEKHYDEAEKCYHYVESNHSLHAVGEKIINGINQSDLFFEDLYKTSFKISVILKILKFSKRYLINNRQKIRL